MMNPTLLALLLLVWPQDPAPTQLPVDEPPPAATELAPEPLPPADSPLPPATPPAQAPAEPFSAAVDVELVQLYMTVTGVDGDPVRGLQRDSFVLREDGQVQTIGSVIDAEDLPLTLGLAIDTSASMFVKLGPVTDTARKLLETLESRTDSAFLVSFGPEPRLFQSTTTFLGEVRSALRYLEPRGSTPLWSSLVLALDELARSTGKRALVVFFDGADDDGDASYRRALARAREVAVPIYLILMNNEAARTEGKEFRNRSFISRLERLAATGGGEVHYVRTDSDLEETYRRIETELRSYYLLTYYPTVPKIEGRRRQIEIDVIGEGLTARTISGYLPEG